LDLLDGVPDLFVFIKDSDRRFVYGNVALLDRLGLSKHEELVGHFDSQFLSREICQIFEVEDIRVLRDGEVIRDRVEIPFPHDDELNWFVTNKSPLFGECGQITGILGMTRPFHGAIREENLVDPKLIPAVNLLQREGHRRVSTTEMAAAAELSLKSLRSRFQKEFGLSPQEYELSNRIVAAGRDLTDTDRPIADIALARGFCDQSAFTHQFKKQTGLTPQEFRNR
ncbi:MAG: AraC family transcriptional regulator, partial [Verrucomicrobiota bacterium]